jgi:cobalamin biosynthesis protein CbiG
MYVVRQGSPERSRRAHHEREKVNEFNKTAVRPESVEGQLPEVLQVPQLFDFICRQFTCG